MFCGYEEKPNISPYVVYYVNCCVASVMICLCSSIACCFGYIHVVLNSLLVLFAGQKMCIFNDHKSYVQGVAWDPLGQYISTLSCDRFVCGF